MLVLKISKLSELNNVDQAFFWNILYLKQSESKVVSRGRIFASISRIIVTGYSDCFVLQFHSLKSSD